MTRDTCDHTKCTDQSAAGRNRTTRTEVLRRYEDPSKRQHQFVPASAGSRISRDESHHTLDLNSAKEARLSQATRIAIRQIARLRTALLIDFRSEIRRQESP